MVLPDNRSRGVVEKIISGGQTGVDRAALDVALRLDIPCGGWCPRGRLAEDGVIAKRYPLAETPSRKYRVRTQWNARDSDGTLIITRGRCRGGTALTEELATQLGKPCLVVDLDQDPDVRGIHAWLLAEQIRVLNVAGPRESQRGGIHDRALTLLMDVLRSFGKS